VNGGYFFPAVFFGKLESVFDNTPAAGFGDRLDADSRVLPDFGAALFGKEFNHLFRLRLAFFKLDAGIEVFRILPDNHDIDIAVG